MNQNPVILFDGVCNLCNSSVNFVIKRDKNAIIQFAPLQSNASQKLLQRYNLSFAKLHSFIFIENEKVFDQSTAALKVCKYLKGLWPLCYVLIIVPRFIRNTIYNWVAKNRYKWFGHKQECMIPASDIKARFLN